MESTKKNTSKYWMLFLVFSILCIAFLVFLPEWFWLVLPFQLGYLVKALDVI